MEDKDLQDCLDVLGTLHYEQETLDERTRIKLPPSTVTFMVRLGILDASSDSYYSWDDVTEEGLRVYESLLDPFYKGLKTIESVLGEN